MRTSAICPSSDAQSGFTLLELVVVLALVTLLGAVVLPNLMKMQQAWKDRTELQDIVSQIRSLGYRARLNHMDVVIGLPGVAPEGVLVVPSGWALEASVPVFYRSNGACLGGTISLAKGDEHRTFTLAPPLCVPEPT